MILHLYGHDRLYDLQSMATAFFPDRGFGPDGMETASRAYEENGQLVCETVIECEGRTAQARAQAPAHAPDAARTAVKRSFYLAAAQFTGRTPAWGMFTGIRPVKEMARYARDWGDKAAQRFSDVYCAAPEKAALCADTLALRREIGFAPRPHEISAYISIPFCPSRCSYCSFISQAGEKMLALIPAYLDRLCGEIRLYGEALRGSGLALRSVYVGGGTPAVLSAAEIRTLLKTVRRALPLDGLQEFTFEAGRPDAVDAEKLRVLRAHNTTRVSINPQTMEDNVLAAIGRRHTADDIRRAMEQVRAANFPHVNMDLIAGLPEDTPEGFARSLDEVISMGADNITVHTLSLKKGSRIMLEGSRIPGADEVAQMLDYADPTLRKHGFAPYYLYRQKYMSGSFENVGWTKPGGTGLYNIYIMEELHSILSLGAGGSTKMVGGGQIRRAFNAKYPREYIDRPEKRRANLMDFARFYAEQGE